MCWKYNKASEGYGSDGRTCSSVGEVTETIRGGMEVVAVGGSGMNRGLGRLSGGE